MERKSEISKLITMLLFKLQAGLEFLFIFLFIGWQPLFGVVMAIAGTWYYAAMLKKNVIDPDYKGSWRKYLRSLLKKK